MAVSKQVRDGFLNDLPEELQLIIMNIHKLLISTCRDVLADPAYDSIRNEEWAKSAIDEFCAQPTNGTPIGSVRVYKQGKRNSCMIQLSGHVINHRNDINHELLHDFFRHVHQDMKAKVRRQFNMKLVCESEHGEPFEGFDLWTDSKIAKGIWNLFDDKKTKKVKAMKESSALIASSYLARGVDGVDDDDYGGINGTHNVNSNPLGAGDMVMMGESCERMFAEMHELPEGLQNFITNLNVDIVESMIDHINDDKYSYMIESDECITADMIIESYYGTSDSDEIGNVTLIVNNDGSYNGYINVTTECYQSEDSKFNKLASRLYNKILKECKINDDYTKDLFINESGKYRSFIVALEPEYAKQLWKYLEGVDPIQVLEEKKTRDEYARAAFKKKYKYNPKDSTIEVDGKRVKVDMGKSPFVDDGEGMVPRNTMITNQGEEKIILDKEFFKLKNPKRRDAVLQHEIGHLKMHRLADGALQDKRFIDKEVIKSTLASTLDPSEYGYDQEILDQLLARYMNSEVVKEALGKKITDSNLEKLRSEAKKAAKKYIPKFNSTDHLNIGEFEADRYSANRTSPSQVMRANREVSKLKTNPKTFKRGLDAGISMTKKAYKDSGYDYDPSMFPPLDRKTISSLIKQTNINHKEDIRMRSKALKDKTLRNSPIYKESYEDDIVFDPFMEADNVEPEYNVDMSEGEAKRTLRTLSQSIMNGIESNNRYKVTQYTANIYANIISKGLLPLWAKGFRKISIKLDNYQSFPTFEFKVPKMTQDFVSRFIQGRETINGLLRRSPEIHIKMSPRIFHTMKNPDDAFNFFRAAIKYYDTGVEKYSDKLMLEAMRLNHEMKHLISTTKLSGIVTCPMQLLFIFDDVEMSDKNTFKISQENIKTVNQFIRNIYTRYAAPEKERKQIVEDINKMIETLKESCDKDNENIKDLKYLGEYVDKYFFNGFNEEIEEHNELWIREHFDMDWVHRQKNPEVKYLQEKFGVKKLKRIPSDLVAYITIETEAIRDANDKMMIASYCTSKIEIVEWYIELLEVGSKKYIVPHSKPYLETIRTQLLACLKKIMETKIVNPNSRPIIDIQYQ